ncbi:MAG TPA: carboxypeptidase-like regulatory domain-containing protein, partial [Gemmataceae bacterium]|nr:carboxypeptidase-like regulatory domain-containing protein [Gemmataceae bacterium]
KLLATVILAAGCLVIAGVREPGLHAGPAGEPPKATPPGEPATPPADEVLTFEGRVVGPTDHPVVGAKLYALYYTPKAMAIPVRGTSDKDGRFRFTMKRSDFEQSYTPTPWRGLHVLARADGHAVGWAVTDAKMADAANLTVRLPADKPLIGRFVSLEGKPIAGLTVQLEGLMRPRAGQADLAALVTELKAKGVGYPVERDHVEGFEGSWIGRDLGSLFPAVTSGQDGKFSIPAIGAERLTVLRITGPGVENKTVRVVTRDAESMTVPEWDRDRPAPGIPAPTTMTYLGQGADIPLAPGRTVTGVVKDAATGKPIPDCQVATEKLANQNVHGRFDWRAVTDRDGKYTLTGLPFGKGNVLRAAPPAGQPYLMQVRDVPAPEGFNPSPLDFELARGVTLEVKAVDAATGKGVAGRFEYFVFLEDAVSRKVPGFTMPVSGENESKDGTVHLVVPATRGMIAFRATADEYPIAVGAEQFKDRSRGVLIQTAPHLCHATNFNMLQAVEVKPGDQAKSVTLKLERGRSVKGRVLDPYGKPLAGCLVRGLKSSKTVFGLWEPEPMKSAEFEARDIGSGKPRAVAFIHKERKLAGTVRVNGGEKEAVE